MNQTSSEYSVDMLVQDPAADLQAEHLDHHLQEQFDNSNLHDRSVKIESNPIITTS